jgi:hypothetical protein
MMSRAEPRTGQLGAWPRSHRRTTVSTRCSKSETCRFRAIHAKVRAGFNQLLEVVEIRAVAGVADDHTRQVHTFLMQEALLVEATPGRGVRMRRDRHAVARCACATARRTRSTPRVTPRVPHQRPAPPPPEHSSRAPAPLGHRWFACASSSRAGVSPGGVVTRKTGYRSTIGRKSSAAASACSPK